MIWACMVQANEMLAVQRENGTLVSSGHLEYDVVRSLLASFSGFLNRKDNPDTQVLQVLGTGVGQQGARNPCER